jgi:hypothetical protein
MHYFRVKGYFSKPATTIFGLDHRCRCTINITGYNDACIRAQVEYHNIWQEAIDATNKSSGLCIVLSPRNAASENL